MREVSDEFLLDEVREGFFIPASIKQAWAAELEVLIEIDRVCKKHGIQYFADWGTFLGAVRHGGYIPWDDDLDIAMKREDYCRFMEVAKSDMKEGFHVQTYDNQHDHWLFIAKVVGRNHMCFEKEHLRNFHNFPYIACVDIFVLDYVYKDSQKEEQRKAACKLMLGVADAVIKNELSENEIESYLDQIYQKCGKKVEYESDRISLARKIYKRIEEKFAEVSESEADYIVQMFPWGLKNANLYMPKEYYANAIRLPFEFVDIPVPVAFNRMLQKRYGNYFTVNKEGGAHNYPFFEGQKKNLLKVLSFELPSFKFDRRIASKKNYSGFKDTVKECIIDLEEITLQIIENSKKDNLTGQILEQLVIAQTLSIDMGTFIESVKGEECNAIALLEAYCEILYMLYKMINENKRGVELGLCFVRLNECWNSVYTSINQDVIDRKNALFLSVRVSDWPSMEGYYNHLRQTGEYDIYVVSLPYFYKDYDGSARKIVCEKEEYRDKIATINYSDFPYERIRLMKPEEIIIQNPYDEWNEAISVDNQYYSIKLKDCTDKLIYIPSKEMDEFNENSSREFHNMKYYAFMPGVVYADCIWLQSEQMKENYWRYLEERLDKNDFEIIRNKIQVNQYLKKGKKETLNKKEILYCVGEDCILDYKERAIEQIKKKLSFLSKKSEFLIHIVEYPNTDLLSEYDKDLYAEYMKMINYVVDNSQFKNIIHDCNACKNRISEYAEKYCAYYGDGSPMVVGFIRNKKTVMIQNYEI